VLLTALSALSDMETRPLYVEIPQSLEIDLETMLEEVFFPI